MYSAESAADKLFLAMAHHRCGKTDEARRLYDETAAWVEKNKPRHPGLRRLRAEAATVLGITGREP